MLKVVFYSSDNKITREEKLSYANVEDIANGIEQGEAGTNGWLPGEDYCDVYSSMNTRPIRFNNYVVPEPKHVVNETTVDPLGYDALLSLFPEDTHEKLRMYTTEELFYVYKLATYKPKLDRRSRVKSLARPSDALFLQLKEKLMAWLRGDVNPDTQRAFGPLSPTVWIKLGSKFKYEFNLWNEKEDSAA